MIIVLSFEDAEAKELREPITIRDAAWVPVPEIGDLVQVADGGDLTVEGRLYRYSEMEDGYGGPHVEIVLMLG